MDVKKHSLIEKINVIYVTINSVNYTLELGYAKCVKAFHVKNMQFIVIEVFL